MHHSSGVRGEIRAWARNGLAPQTGHTVAATLYLQFVGGWKASQTLEGNYQSTSSGSVNLRNQGRMKKKKWAHRKCGNQPELQTSHSLQIEKSGLEIPHNTSTAQLSSVRCGRGARAQGVESAGAMSQCLGPLVGRALIGCGGFMDYSWGGCFLWRKRDEKKAIEFTRAVSSEELYS